ncbi:MAG TPA: sulfotransferase domain-containing protein [Terriglobales bacterium]|nr:sulfotransferase domain-containing protein [Terriglobales bacterium]
MSEQSHNPQPSSKPGTETGRKKPTSAWRKFRRHISKTKLRVPHIWLRHRGITPTDVFFASYPRSGTTWSRFTLFEILTGQEASFHAVNAAVRGVGRHKFGAHLLPANGRLIATHEQYRTDYKKAIYLVRDVRDVILSEFAYTRALEFFRGDLDEFLNVFLCGKISGFGPWPRHITSWLNSPIAGTDNMLVMRFEDLRQNPDEGFSRMADFLGVRVDQERIRRAVANNLLEKMKEKEQAEPQRASVKDRFVRTGSVQAWRSKLSPAQVQFIEQHAGSLLLRLGYQLASGISESAADLNPVLQSTSSIS